MEDQNITQGGNSTELQNNYVGTGVQIGSGFGGMVPLAQQGSVVIGQGELSLFGSQGQLIDKAELAAVEVKSSKITFGSAAWVHMNGKRYSVSIGHGDFMVGPVGIAPTVALGVTSANTGEFIKIFRQLSGKN